MIRLKIAEAFTEGRGAWMRREGGLQGRFIRPSRLAGANAGYREAAIFLPGARVARVVAVSHPGTFTCYGVTE
jgi:hypothetical protein